MSKGASVYPLYIRKFTYSAEDVDCKLCTEYARKTGCRHEVCPFLAERIEAGVVSYQSAVKAMIPRRSILWERLSVLLQNYPGYLWADGNHKTRMELFNHQLGYNKSRNTPSYYAAMFLLTSNQALFNRTGNCFYRSGIEFGYATLGGMSAHNQALYTAAKGLRHARGITEAELADPNQIDDEAFRLIINAMLIAKYGTDVFKLKGETTHEP